MIVLWPLVIFCGFIAIRPDMLLALRGLPPKDASLVDPYYIPAIRFAAIVGIIIFTAIQFVPE